MAGRKIERSKIGKRSMRKGQGFERKVAKILSSWWGIKKSFTRVPLSGGWKYTSDGKIKNRISGDLLTPNEFPFVISCKKVESFEFHNIFSKECIFWKWWEEIRDIALEVHKRPMLIFSRNRWDIFFCIEFMDWKKLHIKSNVLIVNCFGNKLAIGKLKDFVGLALSDNLKLEYETERTGAFANVLNVPQENRKPQKSKNDGKQRNTTM